MLTKLYLLSALASVGLAQMETLHDRDIVIEARDTAAGPDLSEVYINGDIQYAGTGCPAGSVSKFLSDDKTTFTMIFDSFQAQLGPGVDPAQNRKNCQVLIPLHYPSGYQYSIVDMTYRGYYQLDAGVSGQQQSTYYFSGGSQSLRPKPVNFKAGTSGDYTINDKIADQSLIWSPCGASLPVNVNAQVRLLKDKKAPSAASGAISEDSIDGKITNKLKFTQDMGLKWRKCSA